MQTVTSRDGTTIAYDRVGAGPALVLVAGASTTRADLAPLAEALAPRFAVYNYDRRGRGDSGDTAPYVVEREVEDIAAILGAAGGSAFAFGHSSGAVLALEAARLLPSQITRLVLYEPPFIVDDSRPPTPPDGVRRLGELSAAGRRGETVEYWMRQMIGMPPEVVAAMRNDPMWPSLEAIAPTFQYDAAIMGDTMSGRPEPLQRWAAVAIPTLVLDGGASPPFMRNAVQALVDVLPHARRHTLEGQGHGAPPNVLAPVLVEFFTGQ